MGGRSIAGGAHRAYYARNARQINPISVALPGVKTRRRRRRRAGTWCYIGPGAKQAVEPTLDISSLLRMELGLFRLDRWEKTTTPAAVVVARSSGRTRTFSTGSLEARREQERMGCKIMITRALLWDAGAVGGDRPCVECARTLRHELVIRGSKSGGLEMHTRPPRSTRACERD